MNTNFQSCLYVGHVEHHRYSPVRHQLNYQLFMPAIDLDEIDQLASCLWGFGQHRWHWARWRRDDYLGQGPLKTAVQDQVKTLTGVQLNGRVIAVCQLRYLGLYFSPVNFYYLYDEQDTWRYLLAEVSNTPWNERHYYAIPAEKGESGEHWRHAKAFHVSPFNPIDQEYRWRIKPLGDQLYVHLACHKEKKIFDATLVMKSLPLTSRTLLWQLMKTPLLTLKVLVGIYWHALRLWFKGAPYYPHPGKKKQDGNHSQGK